MNLFAAESEHLECRPDLPNGCPRCVIQTAMICCELCSDGDDLFAMLPAWDSPVAPVDVASQSRRSGKIPSNYPILEKERGLRSALQELRVRHTTERFGAAFLQGFGPALFMPNQVLERIVDCARVGKIGDEEQVRRETKWSGKSEDCQEVVSLVSRFFPPMPPPPPPTESTSLSVKRTRTCSKCKGVNHIGSSLYINWLGSLSDHQHMFDSFKCSSLPDASEIYRAGRLNGSSQPRK